MNEERILSVALALDEIYQNEFGGKDRGRFLVDREHLKQLLGVSRLHREVIQALSDACLDLGMVMIDMDDRYGFAERRFVEKWRKLPTRLVEERVNELDSESVDDEFLETTDRENLEDDANDIK